MIYFTEKSNVKNSKFLLSLPFEKLVNIVTDNNEKKIILEGDNLANNYTTDTYVKCLRKYFKLVIASKGNIKRSFKYSKIMVNNGRSYSEGFGTQNLEKKVRGFLTGEYYNDFDMQTAHPSILLYLVKKYYPNQKYKYLEKYIENRKEILKQYNINKLVPITMMNNNKVYNTNEKFLIKLDSEFKNFQNLFFNNTPNDLKQYENYKGLKKNNKEGSFLNKILCIYESIILENVINKFSLDNVSTKMFDGFHLDKNYYIKDTNEIIKILNDITKEYNIKWSLKKPDTTIQIDEGYIEDDDSNDYKTAKCDFEENHFMIENPVIFGRTYTINKKLEYALYSKEDFKTLTKSIKYEDINNNKVINKNFFDSWIEDPEKKSYKNINFVPKLKKNEEYYNTFTGFEAEYIDEYVENDKAIEIFYQHLSLLTNHNKDSIEYLINYIADIVQNPDKLPNVAILFKSKQGFGKDLLLDIISRFIGHKYFYRTANLDEVFGSFNTSIKDKIILQLNELEGKDGFSQKEKIKNLITEEYSNINEKKIKQYKQSNYLRIFIMSNNISPLEIPHDDRRFVVFKAHYRKPDKNYFKQLVDLKNNNDDIKTLYKYFQSYKIKLDLRNDRPLTDAYMELQENCTNPIYNYLNEVFIKGNIEEYYTFEDGEYKIHKKTGNILIKSNDFYENYKNYLVSENLEFMKTNFKLVKSLLADIGIHKKQFKLDNKNNDYYLFNKDIIREHLEHMDLNNEIIEFTDDDFL